MIYLSGHANPMIENDPAIGLMIQPGSYAPSRLDPYPTWAADNACFAKDLAFDFIEYLEWLERLLPWQSRCLFVPAPDVVGDAEATWECSKHALPIIRNMGWPAAFVSQDGLTNPEWDAFDCLFVGGTDDWKFSPASLELVDEANRRGKWTHAGRVNSERRFRIAAEAGFDSADGTFLKYGPYTLIHRLRKWMAWDRERQLM